VSELRLPKPKRAAKVPKPLKRTKRKGNHTSRHRAKREARMVDADKLYSEYIRTRDDWTCKRCGSAHNPQCAHIVSRRYRATRWMTGNPGGAVCLCSRCHMMFTHRPLEWDAWVEGRYPGHLEVLKRTALAGVAHVDYDAVCISILAAMAALVDRRTA
jgi:hypothetical protein